MNPLAPENSAARRDDRVLIAGLGAIWALTWMREAHVWSSGSEHAHGWVVPALALFLFAERWMSRPTRGSPSALVFTTATLLIGALLFGIGRLFLEPSPTWPMMLWVFNVGAIVLSAAVIGHAGGAAWLRHFALPLVFTVTALPWPETIRHGLIDGLAPQISAIAATIVNECSGPAIHHGNLIEVGGGVLTVDAACSGLRSIEATFMVALFLGEFLRLSFARRGALVLATLALAIAGNVARTTTLAWRASSHGLASAAEWHDGAGYIVLGLVLFVVAAIAWLWRNDAPTKLKEAVPAPTIVPLLPRAVLIAAVVLAGAAELGTRGWFNREAAHRRFIPWTTEFPTEPSAYRRTEITAEARAMLDCDRIEARTWQTPTGAPRAGYFAQWSHGHEGRTALALHSPRVCLPLAGARYLGEEPMQDVRVAGQTLRFHLSRFVDGTGEFLVARCAAADDGTPLLSRETPREWWEFRWRAVREVRRHENLQVLVVALWNVPADASAVDELAAELRPIVRPVSTSVDR